MEPNRSAIRAPGTIVKSLKPNTYTGYLAQNKIKLLGSITRERQNLAQATQLIKTPQQQIQAAQPQQSTVPKTGIPAISSSANVTSRIPLKPSRLVRPTPIKQPAAERIRPSVDRPNIATSVHNTTFALRPPTSRANVAVHTTARPPVSSSLVKQPPRLSQTNPDRIPTLKSAALTAPSKIAAQTSNNVRLDQKKEPPDDQVSSSTNDIALTGVSEDVSQIRQLLEQLLAVLKTNSDEHDALAAENARLRLEVVELKEKILAVKSTVSAPIAQTIPEEGETCENPPEDNQLPPRSSVYSTPLI